MCFGHTDGQLIPTIFHNLGNLCFGFLLKVHLRTAVNLCNNLFDFFFYRKIVIIQACVGSWTCFDGLNQGFSKVNSTVRTIRPYARKLYWYLNFSTQFFQSGNFCFCICDKFIDGNHCWNTKLTDIFNVTFQVGKTSTNSFYIFFSQCILSYSAIHLKSTKGCNNHYCVWRCWQVWSLDIKEFLSTKVCTKACLSYCIIS